MGIDRQPQNPGAARGRRRMGIGMPLAGVSRGHLGTELLAGLTLLAIALPLNIGYAQIAGLPPTAGLYALILPTLAWALLASSRQVVASPDAAAAALVASSIGGLAVAGSDKYVDLAFAQAIIGGLLFLLLSVFRLGFLADFLSKPILVGFVGGLALDILISQIAKMLGIRIDSGAEFVAKLVAVVAGLGSTQLWSLAISATSVAVLVLGRRWVPAVPWALIVLVAATAFVALTGLADRGVAVLGEVPAGLPSLSWPALGFSEWLAVIPSALALTLVTTAEGLLVSRSYAEKRSYEVDANRDLLAFGVANIVAGVQSSFTLGSSTSRTAAMDQAGSRTQLPSLVLVAGTVLLLLFGTGLLADVPSPAIGAIVAVAILPLLGLAELGRLWSKDRAEFAVGAICFAVTLLVGAISGILVAFVLAMINLVRRASRPAIDILHSSGDPAESLLEDAPAGSVTAPGVLVIRLAAPLFFANGATFAQAVRQSVEAAREGPVRRVVIDMEAVTDVDVTGAEAFESLKKWLARRDIELSFSRVRPRSRDRLAVLGLLGDEAVYPTNRAALVALDETGRPVEEDGG